MNSFIRTRLVIYRLKMLSLGAQPLIDLEEEKLNKTQLFEIAQREVDLNKVSNFCFKEHG